MHMEIRIIMLGDIVGGPGRRAVAQAIPKLQTQYNPHLIIANGENAANGSGLTPELYKKICKSGVDGITLGDHVFKKAQIVSTLESESNIIRPANLPDGAAGKRWMQLMPNVTADKESTSANPLPPVFVVTVLGRVFVMLPANDPFATVDQVLREIPRVDPIVIVEAHAETTSEKQALGWYLDGRVSAVFGTHTHVATADARILPKGTAYMSDLGMCGPMTSILGRRVDRVLKHMTTAMHAPFDVAEEDPRANGVYIEIDENSRRATKIERIEVKADVNKPPFVM
jgi:2',3'-cyclic-nucleotide 2'-phosphodiesterase